jgi:hypothetical protein
MLGRRRREHAIYHLRPGLATGHRRAPAPRAAVGRRRKKSNMAEPVDLVEQARLAHERITRRLEAALANEAKFPPRGRRTTSYAALRGHIERLRRTQERAHRRYLRRKSKG